MAKSGAKASHYSPTHTHAYTTFERDVKWNPICPLLSFEFQISMPLIRHNKTHPTYPTKQNPRLSLPFSLSLASIFYSSKKAFYFVFAKTNISVLSLMLIAQYQWYPHSLSKQSFDLWAFSSSVFSRIKQFLACAS